MIVFCSLHAQDLEQLKNIKEKDPFSLDGVISGRTVYSFSNGIDARTAPYYYSLSARLNFKIYGMNIPLYFSVRDNSFHYGQTLPRLRLNPRYKWAQLSVGDIYTKFNPYVLSQRNLRGVAVKLTPGKFRFQALQGRMKDLNSFQDTLLLGRVDTETYSQKVIGTGIGVGGVSNYFDLYLLKAWDDDEAAFYLDRDLNQRSNLVIGSTLRFNFLKRFSFQTNTGLSALTYDVNSFGDMLQIGRNSISEDLITVNATTGLSYAGDASLSYRQKTFGLNTKVTYVQAYYQPLTVAYVNTDVLNYTVGGNISLWQQRVFLNTNVGVQRNNVSGASTNATKRFIINAVSRVKLNEELHANLNYNNFSQDYQARLVNINQLYTYAVNNIVQSIGLQYDKPRDDRSLSANVNVGTNSFSTLTEDAESSVDYTSLFARLGFGMNFKQRGINVRTNFDYRNFENQYNDSNNYGVGLSIRKELLDKKMNISFRSNYTMIERLEKREGFSILSSINANYKTDKGTVMQLGIFRVQRNSNISFNYSEWRTQLTVSQKFSLWK